jgi:WD40 repeat protein
VISGLLAERPPWQARIRLSPAGEPQGGGVLCASRWVLTAAHVLGRGDRPPERVWVDFPFAPGALLEAVVVPGGWHPPAAGNLGDLAVAELIGSLPAGVRPAPMRIPATVAGHRFRVYGFPRGHDDGVWARGEVEGSAMGEWTQLVADAGRGYLIDKGFSGSPLWDEALGAVTGVVVSRETDATVRAGFAIGAEVVERYLPMLGPWLCWRVSGDADFADYWDPRARGVERGSRPGVYFTGRHRALERVAGWIGATGNGSCVVTGDPGSGKSALIARLLALGDPQLRDELTGTGLTGTGLTGTGLAGTGPASPATPPVGWASVGARVTGLRLGELADRLAAGLAVPATTPGELVQAVADRPGALLVLDAVDEAADDPARIIRELLLPLVDDAGARVLAGCRRGKDRRLLRAFGSAATVFDLDEPEYFDIGDLVSYSARSLRLDGAVRAVSPYRDEPEVTEQVAAAIATAVRPSFLVAGLAARARAGDRAVIDTSVTGWERRQNFPGTAAAAMDEYVHRLPDPQRAIELLVPVAYARGTGLPKDGLWADLAGAYSGRPVSPAELDRLLDSSAAYLLESASAGGELLVSLFHQALVDYVRSLAAPERADAVFTDVLARRAAQAGGWSAADRYTRRHLAAHAAGAGLLGALIEEPGFLVAAEPGDLLPALPCVTSERGRHIASVYRRYVHVLRGLGDGDRASQLELAARQARDTELADRFAALPAGQTWRALWARWNQGADHIVAGAHHELGVGAVAVGTLRDGTPVVVSGGHDGTLQICDLESGISVHEPLRVHPGPVDSVAVGRRRDGTPVLATGGTGTIHLQGGARVRIWDLDSGTELGGPPRGHDRLTVVAISTRRDGTPVVISCGLRPPMRVWDLDSGAPIGEPAGGYHRQVLAVAAGALRDGTAVAVGGGVDGAICRWSIESGAAIGEPLRANDSNVNAVAVAARRDGTPVLVSGSDDGTVRIWDLETGAAAGMPLRCQDDWDQVHAVAAGTLSDGTPVVAGAGRDRSVRIWDLDTGSPIGEPLRGHNLPVRAITIGPRRDGTPVLVSGGDDGTVRIWDLEPGTPGSPRRAAEGQDYRAASVTIGDRRDGTPVLVTGGDAVQVWNLETGAPLGGSLGHEHSVVATGIRRDGTPAIVSGGRDGLIRIWDLDTGAALGPPLSGHRGAVFAVAVGARRDGTPVLISGGEDCTVRIWDLESGASVGEPLRGHGDWVTSVCAGTLRDGTPVVVSGGSEDGTVLRRDLDTRAAIGTPLTGHDAVVSAVATGALGDGTPVLATADEAAVRIFDLETGAMLGDPLTGHDDLITTVAIGAGRDGPPVVVSGDRAGLIQVWALGPQATLRHRIHVHSGVRQVRVRGSGLAVAAGGVAVLAWLANR